MKNVPAWNFPINQAGNTDGFNDSGIENFKDNLLLSLAKEACQNSLDAKDNIDGPVTVEFEKFEISKNAFPGYDEFVSVITKEIDFWATTNNDKSALNFFERAYKILKSGKITCLRISDFNTTGLENSSGERFSGWNKLVKMTGVSDNKSNAGGSFGIGKFACFACSDLHTVFYSTKARDGFRAYQGVSRLASFEKDGNIIAGTGYYGLGFDHIEEILKMGNFERNKNGTDIFILGFESRDADWKDKIFASVIDSFMIAINNGNLNFKIGNSELKKQTLGKFMEKYRTDKYRELLNQNTIDYYDVLNKKYDFHKFAHKVFEKDDLELHISIAEGNDMNNRVGIIRNNGMKIFDLARLPPSLTYSGILFLKGERVNEYFRALENAKHDGWSADRSINKKDAQEKIKIVYKFVRDSILELAQKLRPDSFDAGGVGEYLPDDQFESGGKDIEEDITDDIKDIKSVSLEMKKKENLYVKGKGGRSRKKIKHRGGGNGGTSGPGDKDNGKSERRLYISSSRFFIDKNGDYRLKFLSSEEIKRLRIDIDINGEVSNDKFILSKAKRITDDSGEVDLKFKENKIYVDNVEENDYITIIFGTPEKEKWALEVKYYED